MNVPRKIHGHRRTQPPGMSLVVVVSLVGLLTLLAVSLLTLVSLNRQTRHLEVECAKPNCSRKRRFTGCWPT